MAVGTGLTYFDTNAIKLCSQKVAKTYGDVRKCLEVCRASLDTLLEKCDEIESGNMSISDDTQLKVGFREMQIVLRTAFGIYMCFFICGTKLRRVCYI